MLGSGDNASEITKTSVQKATEGRSCIPTLPLASCCRMLVWRAVLQALECSSGGDVQAGLDFSC